MENSSSLSMLEAQFTCNGIGPVPLLGFTNLIEYYPSRVTGHYQVVQKLPPALQPELILVDFTEEDCNHEGPLA